MAQPYAGTPTRGMTAGDPAFFDFLGALGSSVGDAIGQGLGGLWTDAQGWLSQPAPVPPPPGGVDAPQAWTDWSWPDLGTTPRRPDGTPAPLFGVEINPLMEDSIWRQATDWLGLTTPAGSAAPVAEPAGPGLGERLGLPAAGGAAGRPGLPSISRTFQGTPLPPGPDYASADLQMQLAAPEAMDPIDPTYGVLAGLGRGLLSAGPGAGIGDLLLAAAGGGLIGLGDVKEQQRGEDREFAQDQRDYAMTMAEYQAGRAQQDYSLAMDRWRMSQPQVSVGGNGQIVVQGFNPETGEQFLQIDNTLPSAMLNARQVSRGLGYEAFGETYTLDPSDPMSVLKNAVVMAVDNGQVAGMGEAWSEVYRQAQQDAAGLGRAGDADWISKRAADMMYLYIAQLPPAEQENFVRGIMGNPSGYEGGRVKR